MTIVLPSASNSEEEEFHFPSNSFPSFIPRLQMMRAPFSSRFPPSLFRKRKETPLSVLSIPWPNFPPPAPTKRGTKKTKENNNNNNNNMKAHAEKSMHRWIQTFFPSFSCWVLVGVWSAQGQREASRRGTIRYRRVRFDWLFRKQARVYIQFL